MTKQGLKRGQWVKSQFRARWYGYVLAEIDEFDCLSVRVVYDQCGRPMRKPMTKRLHVNWLIPHAPPT